LLAKQFAKSIYKKTKSGPTIPYETQHTVFKDIIRQAENTQFGIDHHFDGIKPLKILQKKFPFAIMKNLKPYVERVVKGEENILWKGKPLVFCQNIRNHFWSKIHSVNQRINAFSY
jgi:hypothetical protein